MVVSIYKNLHMIIHEHESWVLCFYRNFKQYFCFGCRQGNIFLPLEIVLITDVFMWFGLIIFHRNTSHAHIVQSKRYRRKFTKDFTSFLKYSFTIFFLFFQIGSNFTSKWNVHNCNGVCWDWKQQSNSTTSSCRCKFPSIFCFYYFLNNSSLQCHQE